jgi:hypothetical protein
MVTGKYTTTMPETCKEHVLMEKLRNVKIPGATIYPKGYYADFPVRQH